MQLVRRRVRSCESPSSALCVFAFNTGLLWDHINGAFLVRWHVLARGGVGAPGQPISSECEALGLRGY